METLCVDIFTIFYDHIQIADVIRLSMTCRQYAIWFQSWALRTGLITAAPPRVDINILTFSLSIPNIVFWRCLRNSMRHMQENPTIECNHCERRLDKSLVSDDVCRYGCRPRCWHCERYLYPRDLEFHLIVEDEVGVREFRSYLLCSLCISSPYSTDSESSYGYDSDDNSDDSETTRIQRRQEYRQKYCQKRNDEIREKRDEIPITAGIIAWYVQYMIRTPFDDPHRNLVSWSTHGYEKKLDKEYQIMMRALLIELDPFNPNLEIIDFLA